MRIIQTIINNIFIYLFYVIYILIRIWVTISYNFSLFIKNCREDIKDDHYTYWKEYFGELNPMNKFVENFQLKEKYQNIKPFICEFREGLNIIVGENGSGKSTMLQLMSDNKKDLMWSSKKPKFFSIKLVNPGQQIDTRFLDTEKNNPRMQHSTANSKNVAFQVSSHFISHGEAMLPLVKACKGFKDNVIFIDEPESGISLKNQKQILNAFRKAVRNGCQIIVTTHSYILIKGVKEVFSLDSREWISSKEYLKEVVK